MDEARNTANFSGGPSDTPPRGEENSSQEAVGASDEEGVALGSKIAEVMVVVEPILNEMFKAAANNEDYWLKGKSIRVITDWIISILNISQVMEQQIRAQGEVLAAQEAELESLREKKSKMWVPGV